MLSFVGLDLDELSGQWSEFMNQKTELQDRTKLKTGL